LPNLSYSVRLGVISITLQVYQRGDTFFSKNMATSSYPLNESQAQQEQPEVVKTDIRICPAAQDSLFQPIVPIHHEF